MILHLIVGHGLFGQGISNAINMILGTSQNVVNYNFLLEQSPESLKEDIEKIINQPKNLEQVYIYTDLIGGTPFKTCAEIANENSCITLFSGVNLPLILSIVLESRYGVLDKKRIVQIIEDSKENLILF